MGKIHGATERLHINPIQAASAGEADAHSLLLSVQEGDIPTTQLSDIISEMVGLAAANKMDECSFRLDAFCEVLGPGLHKLVHDQSAAREASRIAGALECIAALRQLEHSAENLPESDDGAVYYHLQSGDAERLVSLFGPLTPRQEGAFRTLAEYIHCRITSGLPNLERWLPVVALTERELQDKIDETNSLD